VSKPQYEKSSFIDKNGDWDSYITEHIQVMRVFADYWSKVLTPCWKYSREQNIKTTERKQAPWTAHQQQIERAPRKK